LSPRQSLQDKKADLAPPSLHRKIPFPTRMSETGSMTGWWVFSLCPTTSTTHTLKLYRVCDTPPQSQRHVCHIPWLARSLLLQFRRMSPFRRPVSAAKNSVPGSSFGDWFDLCVGSWQFGQTARFRHNARWGTSAGISGPLETSMHWRKLEFPKCCAGRLTTPSLPQCRRGACDRHYNRNTISVA
jgi:hypothetical protein